MTIVNDILRLVTLVDVQFWRERDGSWTVTIIAANADGKVTAIELPEHIFNEAKATHALFNRKRGAETARMDSAAIP